MKTAQYRKSNVTGYLDEPDEPGPHGVVLTHGAGGNANGIVLVALGAALAELGCTVLRVDLPFRQQRPSGPPRPSDAALDRAGLQDALHALRGAVRGRIVVGGQSYGGRQASMLMAESPQSADGLLLLSYPLHPPGQPTKLRVAHFPALKVRAFFVHGLKDPFGTEAEMHEAIRQIPAPPVLRFLEGVGHDLGGKRFNAKALAPEIEEWIRHIG